MSYKEGDYFYSKGADDKGKTIWSVYRCLKIDSEFNIAHTMFFQPISKEPKEDDVKNLEIMMAHAPIQTDGFENPVVFASGPVTKQDLEGYHEHLKFTDFQLYLDETGADVDAMTIEAEKLFEMADGLYDQEQFAEAADFYYQAYEAFPPYFEALDNAGISLMDANQYADAINCFEESIEINGNTFMTDFSIAQCYQYLDDLESAKEWYEKARETTDMSQEQRDLLNEVLAAF